MKRSAPLQRRTPLRAKTRMKARGSVKGRWTAWQAECRAIVVARAAGHCEACHCPNGRAVLGSRWGLELAHIFGRRNVVGEPWASSAALTMMLCPTCHDRLDGRVSSDMSFRVSLRWQAINRWLAALTDERVEVGPILGFLFDDPLGAARMIEGQLRELRRVGTWHVRGAM